jgi:hypothetical protein
MTMQQASVEASDEFAELMNTKNAKRDSAR